MPPSNDRYSRLFTRIHSVISASLSLPPLALGRGANDILEPRAGLSRDTEESLASRVMSGRLGRVGMARQIYRGPLIVTCGPSFETLALLAPQSL